MLASGEDMILEFTQVFRVQAMEEAIQRPAGVGIREMAASLQVGRTLHFGLDGDSVQLPRW